MRYKRAEVNGINCNATSFHPQELWDEFLERAHQLREDAKEIIEGKPKGNGYYIWREPGRFHFGPRFYSDKRIAERAISGIVTAGLSFATLGIALMDEYIIAAFIDAASADHWYTFEKRWE
jgi:hypothetical protein